MNITLITVGKLKEDYLKRGIDYYIALVKKQHNISIITLEDEQTPDHASPKVEEQIKDIEGSRILSRIHDNDYVITLEIEGKQLDSKGFMKILKQYKHKDIVYIIGGSLGLSEAVKKRSNKAISFSEMTFPHQLMQLILMEQISRALN